MKRVESVQVGAGCFAICLLSSFFGLQVLERPTLRDIPLDELLEVTKVPHEVNPKEGGACRGAA